MTLSTHLLNRNRGTRAQAFPSSSPTLMSLTSRSCDSHRHPRISIMASQTSSTKRSIFALSLIGAFGVNSMYGLVWRNGYIASLLHLRDHGPYVLPGSSIPILTSFTGISIVDKALTLAGVMFANVTDGSAPASSLYGFQFAGQLVPMFTIMLVEAARRGNGGNVMSW